MAGRLTIQHFMEEQSAASAAAIRMRDRIAEMLDTVGASLWPGIVPDDFYRVRGSELIGVFGALAEVVRKAQP